MSKNQTSPVYNVLKRCVRLVYRKMEIVGMEHLPDEPALIVANHCQLHGPISCELYFPEDRYTWCIGEMMHLKEVPAYAYKDFWSGKPKCCRWFYKLLSYLIAPLSVYVFNNASTIAVYHDARLVHTFKETVSRLQEGANVVVFPEHYEKYSNIVNDFQVNFVNIARLYYKQTGKELSFVPMYIAPNLKKMYLGKPIQFCAAKPMDEQRRQICDYLMNEITKIGCSLPAHTVIPYPNIPKKYYPNNLPRENYKEAAHEKAGR